MRRGTAPYIHPWSLIEAASCGSVDDAYALGFIAYQCLAEEQPWNWGGALDLQLTDVLFSPRALRRLQRFCAQHEVRA